MVCHTWWVLLLLRKGRGGRGDLRGIGVVYGARCDLFQKKVPLLPFLGLGAEWYGVWVIQTEVLGGEWWL